MCDNKDRLIQAYTDVEIDEIDEITIIGEAVDKMAETHTFVLVKCDECGESFEVCIHVKDDEVHVTCPTCFHKIDEFVENLEELYK